MRARKTDGNKSADKQQPAAPRSRENGDKPGKDQLGQEELKDVSCGLADGSVRF